MTEGALDASAMLAVILGEPGSEHVQAWIEAGTCSASAVNVSEVVAKLAERGASRAEIIEGIAALGVAILLFEHADAIEAGMLRPSTRSAGLSFADRACVTLAARLNAHVITADRAFARVELPAPVELFRTPQVQDQ